MLPKAIASVLTLLVVVASALAQSVKGPAEITVSIGRLAAIPLTIDADEVKYDVLGADYFDSFREFSAPTELRLRVMGYANGTGWIVVSSTKGGKLQPNFIVKVTVGEGPKPPVPPKPPDPPAPVDPLVESIRAAAKADGWTGDKLKALSNGLAAAESVSKSRATWTVADLAFALQAAIKTAVGTATPTNLKKLLGDTVNAVLPRDADHELTTDEMIKCRELLMKLSKACEAASK